MSATRLAYSVDEAAAAIGVSRNYVGRLVSSGDLPSFLLGRRRLITTTALTAYLARLERDCNARTGARPNGGAKA